MRQAILDFSKQFDYRPEVVNGEQLERTHRLVVGGMGGSHLAAGVLKAANPFFDIHVHHDYDLPLIVGEVPKDHLLVASSYSGNTEEALSFFDAAHSAGLSVAVVTTGGQLLERAQSASVPHIILPDTGIQPRNALGFAVMALARLMGDAALVDELGGLSQSLDAGILESNGKELAESLLDSIPLIYTSNRNHSLAYNWKIKMNETGKVPAFYNTFPELNHNEMEGFDFMPETRHLSEQFHCVFIGDSDDHERVQRRMEVTEEVYEHRSIPVTKLWLTGSSRFEQLFNSLTLADWTAYYLAEQVGAEPATVRMIETFKKKLG